VKNQSRSKTRLNLCMDSRLKTALLQTAALVGIAGHMGNRGLFLIERFLSNKLR
jgi:hypothetical protein